MIDLEGENGASAEIGEVDIEQIMFVYRVNMGIALVGKFDSYSERDSDEERDQKWEEIGIDLSNFFGFIKYQLEICPPGPKEDIGNYFGAMPLIYDANLKEIENFDNAMQKLIDGIEIEEREGWERKNFEALRPPCYGHVKKMKHDQFIIDCHNEVSQILV